MKRIAFWIFLFHHFLFPLSYKGVWEKNNATNTPRFRTALSLAYIGFCRLRWCAWLPGVFSVGKASVAFPQQCWRMWSLAAWRVRPLALFVEDMARTWDAELLMVRCHSFKSSLGIMKSWNNHLIGLVVWKILRDFLNPHPWGKWWPIGPRKLFIHGWRRITN